MDEEYLPNPIEGNFHYGQSTFGQRRAPRRGTHQAVSARHTNNTPPRNAHQRGEQQCNRRPRSENWRRRPRSENWRQPRNANSANHYDQAQGGSGQANQMRPKVTHGAAAQGSRMNRLKPNASTDDQENQNEIRGNRKQTIDRPRNDDQKERSSSRKTYFGFNALKEISLSDSKDILEKLNKNRNDFLNLVNNNIDSKDVFVLIIEILSKVCQSSFDELKQRLLLDVVNSSFIRNLTSYLVHLPYSDRNDKFKNKYYWDNQNKFWDNIITFSECIFNVAPSVALQRYRPALDLCKICLDGMNTRQAFKLSDENATRFTELLERITVFEQKSLQEKSSHPDDRSKEFTMGESEPLESFRELSVVPSREDLLGQKPFLRANIVLGGYRDVEHYLDVQFRLLREDCFGPLRDGLFQYMKDPNKTKYDNIRVYRDVRFVAPYVKKNNVGVSVQLDEKTVKRHKKVNWSHSKRFIFGSLLLFTRDNCQTFITATIIDRDTKELAKGRIPIRIIENDDASTEEQTKGDGVFVMIESEVYFEPYQHVLKVLQDPRFPENLAMSKYIVNVEPEATRPKYMKDHPLYKVDVETIETTKTFLVENPDTWPRSQELGFNESQYEAYKLALTHEFAVIQGPPGTGKTYLGVKVAQTLLSNIPAEGKCLLLVICYTNHALDQFLEHILKITQSIVRVGGQSRNPAMEAISLNTLRRSNHSKKHREALNLYYSERQNIQKVMAELQTAQNRIQSLRDGVLSYESIKDYIPEVTHLEHYYGTQKGDIDILKYWLFEKMPYKLNYKNLLEENNTDGEEQLLFSLDSDGDEENTRHAAILDDLFDNKVEINGIEIKTSFLAVDAKRKLNHIISYYKRSENKREKENLKTEIIDLNSRLCLFEEMKDAYRTRGGVSPDVRENLKRMSNVDRWSLYFTWANKLIAKINEEVKPLQENFNSAMTSYEEARMILDLKFIQDKNVVGMTTSGAARLRKLLQALAPTIVIVEEAAEVLEQHIVTALSSSCQHLILIGDHQQLRPSAAYLKLARKYNIDVSLFERMVNNGMHSRRLSVQHRMRPEIAALISPHIYEDLINHPSVDAYPHVRGITTSLFFFTHNYKEECIDDSASRLNQREADMTLGLAKYIMQQGYQPEDVTILAAYTGQMFYMKKQRSKYAFLDKIKITVVDNYQGEESKIILLSLVRNNDQNKIGFLGTENRICVALSRAKEGFFIFGNIEILKSNSTLWAKIAKTLEDMGSIGSELRLKCENHHNQFSLIMSPKDFEKVPEGGCQLKCNYNLPVCGHRCPRICHGYDLGHSNIECQLQCERVLCDLGHVCPLKCVQKCQPCKKRIVKTLTCGHAQKVYCHQEPNDPEIKCITIVSVVLADCGHTAQKYCYVNMNKAVCPVPCKYRVECGHECRRRCHVNDDPNHEQYECYKPCAKAKRGCTANLMGDRGEHQCSKMCHASCDDCNVEVIKKRSNCRHSKRVKCCQNVDELPCHENCARIIERCGHHCKKKCFEPCGDCNQKTTKNIPECQHKIELACNKEPMANMCREPCERRLSCGHRCMKLCREPCDEKACVEIINRDLASPCGHKVKLPCNVFMERFSNPEVLMRYCTAPCNMTLKCEHVCAGTCAGCIQGRLHAPCTKPCHVIMICGHRCEEPCRQMCLPCKKPCEVKCAHSQCQMICGAPCVPCQEACPLACAHGGCGRRCGEPCERATCDEPCPLALPCGHPCRGLCGEPCPDICRICRPDEFPKDFLGDDFDDDAKFIKLQDCSHVMEVEDSDNLMQGDRETISIRSCPFCRKPIINTYRYKGLVNEQYRTEINPIKEKVFGTKAQVKDKRKTLEVALHDFKNRHGKLVEENQDFSTAYRNLIRSFSSEKMVSIMQLDMYFIYIDILDMIADYYKKNENLTELRKEFLIQIKLICDVLKNNIRKLSQQQQEDIAREIKRMNSIIQLSKILSHTSYLSTKQIPKVAAAANEAKSLIISWKTYEEENAIDALKKFEEAVKLNGIVIKEERDLIVQAIGLKQGHWFKCPNGHFYCIGECGGAMQISKCIECGVAIGGQSHALLSTNAHAREIDGSSFPAWSEHNNNMANFDLENF